MNSITLLRLSLRSIMRNRMRSLLTSLGVIIGVSSVIILVSIGEGSQAVIRENISAMGTNLIQVLPPRGRFSANRLTSTDVQAIREEAIYISAVSGIVRAGLTAAGGSGYWSTTVWGCEEDYLHIRNWKLAEGDMFTPEDNHMRRKVAVIGASLVNELFKNQQPIGQTLRLANTPVSIIGVLESKGTNSIGNDQDNVVLVPLNTARGRLSRQINLDSIELSARGEDYMSYAQQEVQDILRISHRLAIDSEDDFTIFNQEEIINMAASTSKTLTVLLAAIAAVSLLVGGIGIMNIMLVSVSERTRETGIRLSIGARKIDILRQFLTEAVVLSFIGGLIGILFSLLAIYLLNNLWHIRAIINIYFILFASGFAALIGIFFGFYPARKAASMNPIDALRTE